MEENQTDPNTIQVLSGLQAIRRRPGMYIGYTNERGLGEMVNAIVETGVDAAFVDKCNSIYVRLNKDESFLVKNNAPPLPTAYDEKLKMSPLQYIMLKPHWDAEVPIETSPYNHSRYSLPVVQALSEWGWVAVKNSDGIYKQSYARGEVTSPVELQNSPELENELSGDWNNAFCFKPDPQIFETLELPRDRIANLLQMMAFAVKGLRFELSDEKTGRNTVFHYPQGIVALVEQVAQSYEPLMSAPIYGEATEELVRAEVALQYRKNLSQPALFVLMNYFPVEFEGTPAKGFRQALYYRFNKYARQPGVFSPAEVNLSHKKLENNLIAVINLHHPQPIYYGPTKTSAVLNPEIRQLVNNALSGAIASWTEKNRAEARALLDSIRQFESRPKEYLSAPGYFRHGYGY
jgi:DNA gyrase subunit B